MTSAEMQQLTKFFSDWEFIAISWYSKYEAMAQKIYHSIRVPNFGFCLGVKPLVWLNKYNISLCSE